MMNIMTHFFSKYISYMMSRGHKTDQNRTYNWLGFILFYFILTFSALLIQRSKFENL